MGGRIKTRKRDNDGGYEKDPTSTISEKVTRAEESNTKARKWKRPNATKTLPRG